MEHNLSYDRKVPHALDLERVGPQLQVPVTQQAGSSSGRSNSSLEVKEREIKENQNINKNKNPNPRVRRQERKRRNAQTVYSQCVQQLQQLQGASDALEQKRAEMSESRVEVKNGGGGPKNDSLTPKDQPVVLPRQFDATDERLDSWWQRAKSFVRYWIDGVYESCQVKHTWTINAVESLDSRFQKKSVMVFDDERDEWVTRTFYTTREVIVEDEPILVNPADDRVVLSRGFDLLRGQPQILHAHVECIQRGYWWGLFPRRSSYNVHVSASVVADVLSNDGFLLTGVDDYERLDSRFVQVARATNLPYYEYLGLRTHTVQFLLDYCCYQMREHGHHSSIKDFQCRPVSL